MVARACVHEGYAAGIFAPKLREVGQWVREGQRQTARPALGARKTPLVVQ